MPWMKPSFTKKIISSEKSFAGFHICSCIQAESNSMQLRGVQNMVVDKIHTVCWKYHQACIHHQHIHTLCNKLASSKLRFRVRNYHSPTDLLTGVKCRATSVAKKGQEILPLGFLNLTWDIGPRSRLTKVRRGWGCFQLQNVFPG